ncbi:MAG: PhoU domain-containing protein [Candidatus Woesearchaeota archaeon]
MYIRRLVKAGQASHTISLPKEWIEKNNLSKGSTLYIKEKSGTELIITPNLADQKHIDKKTVTINVEGKQPDTIQREITAAYLNNAGTIELVGKSIMQHAKDIRRMLHDFVALEISEQTSTRISAKDLLNLKEISVDKSIKRMDLIVRTMLQDCKNTALGNDLSESVILRDYDVNRLYFLLTRLLKGALASPEMASILELEPAKVLGKWMLVHYIEEFADTIKALCKECVALDPRQGKDVSALLSQIEQDYLDVMKALHEDDKSLADDVARRRTERAALCRAIKDLPEISHGCTAITSLVSNIARVVIDES